MNGLRFIMDGENAITLMHLASNCAGVYFCRFSRSKSDLKSLLIIARYLPLVNAAGYFNDDDRCIRQHLAYYSVFANWQILIGPWVLVSTHGER